MPRIAPTDDTFRPMQSRTKVAHKTLKPQWNEELHVLVQEPTTQLLRVEMFDHDTFNVKVGPGARNEVMNHYLPVADDVQVDV